MTQETISEPTSNDITSNEPNTPNHLPVTKKLYLSDSTILEGEAIILSMEEISNESSNQPSQFNIILDQTYFHCQGGGQSGDMGYLENEHGKFQVEKTIHHPESIHIVVHQGHFIEGSFECQAQVHMSVDKEFRMKNTRLHSAGHLLDQAMIANGFQMKPTKGNHIIGQSYVEYEGIIPPNEREETIKKLQSTCNELIEKDIPTIIEYWDPKDVPHDTSYLLPNEKARVVHVGGKVDYPCSGTHVRSTKEIGSLLIEKIKVKKGITHISYKIQDL